MLFMQHFMKRLKTWGRAAIIVPEGVLFNTSNSFQEVKKELLEHFDLHSIVSLPAWVFLPYSGVKTNIIFFEKSKPTEKIRYYEVNLDRKLTKNKPISYDDMQDMITSFKTKATWENSWIVDNADIRDFDISAKNPAKIKEIIHVSPTDILEKIKITNNEIEDLTNQLHKIINK
jgi:type I restriction enzyme M protein